MFEPGESPRCYAVPVGRDFFQTFLDGLRARLDPARPEAMARVTVFVNARRAERHLRALFQNGPAGFLPRIRVIDDLAGDLGSAVPIPAPVSALRRKLELGRLISALLEVDPGLAPRAAVFDLAEALADLMDEMHGEGVPPGVLEKLDISSHANHWEKSLTFLRILTPFFEDTSAPGADARQRLVIERMILEWQNAPPGDPVIVAGSTGSRGAMALLMRAVAGLPQGAVVLPGYDTHTPATALLDKSDRTICPEHPQTGLFRFIDSLGLAPDALPLWTTGKAENTDRNRLISLALRPAPVTDHWLKEGPELKNLAGATAKMTLIEVATPRAEALAIALRLRRATEEGRRATLISPDRTLTRRVTAALSQWGILPDDSAGRPLPLTPPGVFLRMIADLGDGLASGPIAAEALLALLKHPLTHSGAERNLHLLRTRDLELNLLRGGPPFVDFNLIARWAAERQGDNGMGAWVDWLKDTLGGAAGLERRPLPDLVAVHRAMADTLSRGSVARAGDGGLWQEAAGQEAARIFDDLADAADAGGDMSSADFAGLFQSVLEVGEVRDSSSRHPHISIWGPREARLLTDDLVILGGLNEGVWPKLPSPDPWLSRDMRREAGLLLPERQIGLSAHDFQMAAGVREVVLSRAMRDADAPTVASRWLIRLTNLLSGIGADGLSALAGMRTRGRYWRDLAEAFEQPRCRLLPEGRPAPRPPIDARPDRLSVTQIKTLIRDPYAIYARRILRLYPLDPVRTEPDALLRGRAVHLVMERFVRAAHEGGSSDDRAAQFAALAQQVLADEVPWPATRRLWLARLARIENWFIAGEAQRAMRGTPVALECKGAFSFGNPAFTLTGTVDRIDRTPNGGLIIYDYKTGTPPSKAQIEHFDKQLPLEGAMATRGAFRDLDPMPVEGLEYIGLGSSPKTQPLDLSDDLIEEAWRGLQSLISAYGRLETAYTARARMEKRTDRSDYDHLSRRGEWEDSDPASPRDVP